LTQNIELNLFKMEVISGTRYFFFHMAYFDLLGQVFDQLLL